MHAPSPLAQPARPSATADHAALLPSSQCPWGILIAHNSPTRENGLLAFAESRYTRLLPSSSSPPSTAVAHLSQQQLVTGSEVMRVPGDAWIWEQLPPHLRYRHFPVNASLEWANKEEGKALADILATVQLLLPLCHNNGVGSSSMHEQNSVSLGRLSNNDIVLPTNPCLSSVHCSLSCQPTSTRGRGEGVADAAVRGSPITENKDASMQREAEDAKAAMTRAAALCHGPSTEVRNEDKRRHRVGQSRRTRDPEEAPPSGDADDESYRSNVHIILSDYSTNGCIVNGAPVGKGRSARLHDGDTVELINAGPRHTADYNLSFTFVTLHGFRSWLQQQQQQQQTPNSQIVLQVSESQASHRNRRPQKQEAELRQTAARRRALLCKAQWNVEAQVRRMYSHRVDEYYVLDRANPLGEGTFGVVYRAALRSAGTGAGTAPSLKDASTTTPLRAIAAALLEKVKTTSSSSTSTSNNWEQLLFSTAAACVWTANTEDEAALGDAYVMEKEQRAPGTVQRAVATNSAITTAAGCTSDAASRAFLFAVKVIKKQRMLLDVLQQHLHEHDGSNDSDEKTRRDVAPTDGGLVNPPPPPPATTTPISAMSDAEAAVLQQLVLLETQPDDLAAERREEWTAGALASLQLADGGGASLAGSHTQCSPLSGSLEALPPAFSFSPPASSVLLASSSGCADEALVATTVDARSRQQREQRRLELLRRLPEPLRRTYERELQHRRRQQCEINILLAVRHPNVTTLYEVFDQPDQLALVMEQATGGEVWDLLHPYQRRKVVRRAVKHARAGEYANAASTPSATATTEDRNRHPSTRASGGEEASYDDVDLVGIGGPLPEYLVKLIVVQVLEAVLYLHTMGIIHRDLKLENLMLQRPCDRYALNALQLQLLLHQLRDYELMQHQQQQHQHSTAPSPTPELAMDVEFSNPLSVLHTVHIPRALWPVVKVTDFGLSRVLDQLPTRPSSSSSTAAATLHGFAAAPCTSAERQSSTNGTTAVLPERVRLIYSRNDATTSCGTPIYAAPEVTHPSLRPNKVGYSAAVDMYSVGVIAYALLTGRAPFPSRRDPRRPTGALVVDYDAPLKFNRRRRRSSPSSTTADETTHGFTSSVSPPPLQPACADYPTARLPPLALVEYVRLPLPPSAHHEAQQLATATAGASPSTAFSPTATTATRAATAAAVPSAQARQWRTHVDAVAAHVLRAEHNGVVEEGAAHSRAGASTHSHSRSSPPLPRSPTASSIVTATVHQLRHALAAYAESCTASHEEVDLDRLWYVSTQAVTRDSSDDDDDALDASSSGRAFGPDGRVEGVALPPISALGASFVRGLLEKYPSQRLTAYEALQHPWLRECVAAAEAAATSPAQV